MTEAPHDEAGTGEKTKRITGTGLGHDGWRSGGAPVESRRCVPVLEVRGQGYPLVVMYGGPSADHYTMLPFRQCADQFTVILYDHRCNGRSTGAPVSSMTFETLTADAEALRQKLGFDWWAVPGHSFGGHVAQQNAADTARRPAGAFLALLAPLPVSRIAVASYFDLKNLAGDP
jgi:pimeloyl-ACP methyl ester carboxylesterase